MRHPVIIVGAGPVGLAAAIDLGQRGVPVVVLDDSDRIGEGSRGICWSKRTLEILDRYGIGEALGGAGRHLEARQGVSRRRAGVLLRPVAGGRPQDAGLHQPAAVLSGEGAGRSRARARRHRSALAQSRRGARTAQRWSPADHRDAGWPLHARCRLADRGRRRALDHPRPDGARLCRRHVRGQVPHRRCAHGGGFSDRAPVLVCADVSFRPIGADAPPAATMSGASISSSAPMPTPRPSSSPNA